MKGAQIKRKGKYLFSPIKKKILLLLLTGVELSFTRLARKQLRIIKKAKKEWNAIDTHYLWMIIREFKYNRLIEYKENTNGSTSIILTEQGKNRALTYQLDTMTIARPSYWDGKWRLVLFDIPERVRQGRDALRNKLKDLGFVELQKSVWVYPYACKDEINFIVEIFDIRRFVRYAELTHLTLEEELLIYFKLKKSRLLS